MTLSLRPLLRGRPPSVARAVRRAVEHLHDEAFFGAERPGHVRSVVLVLLCTLAAALVAAAGIVVLAMIFHLGSLVSGMA